MAGVASEEFSREIQNEIEDNAAMEAARQRAEEILEAEVEEENAKTPWYKKIFGAVRKIFIRVASIICSGVRDTVVFIINNEQNQTLAKLAVLTAMEAGLKGENAFAAAWKILHEGKLYISEHIVVDPKDVDKNIKQTLIQLVYTCIKNRIVPLSLPEKPKDQE